MDIRKKIEFATRKTGQSVYITVDGVTHSFYAQVQPIHDKSKLYLESSYSSLGKIDRSHALYYGPSHGGGELVKEGLIITANNTDYVVKISEPFYLQDKTAYIWAILQRSFNESEGI